MQGLKQRIVKWNRDRGLIQAGFDPALELKMLSEEAREFFLANDYEHQLQEFADFLFVEVGTRAKFFSMRHESASVLSMVIPQWGVMNEWIVDTKEEMYEILISKADVMMDLTLQEKIQKALRIVVEANEAKGDKVVDGKVIKNTEHIDPRVKIKAMVDDMRSSDRHNTDKIKGMHNDYKRKQVIR